MYLYSSSVGFSVCLDNRGFSLHFFFHLALTDLESLTSSVNNHNNNTKKIIKFAFPFLILFSYQKFFFFSRTQIFIFIELLHSELHEVYSFTSYMRVEIKCSPLYVLK